MSRLEIVRTGEDGLTLGDMKKKEVFVFSDSEYHTLNSPCQINGTLSRYSYLESGGTWPITDHNKSHPVRRITD